MGQTTSSTSGPSDGRRPYGKVGLALLALVVALVVAAFYLDRHLRPSVGISAPPTPTGAPSNPTPRTAPPTAGATAVPTSATPTATVAPGPTVTPRQQLEQAYYRYWRDYSQALFTLDTSRMSDVAAGDELKRVQAEVADLRQRNHAVHVRVSHSALIVSIKGDTATVYDDQRDSSFLINPVTKEPHKGSVQPYPEKDIYYLRKMNGNWKVVKSLRQR